MKRGVLTPVQSMSRRQKSDSKKAASRGLQWTSDMIRKIVDDKTYIGCMVYGKTKIPDYEKRTREMLEEYVQGIYVYDDGRVEVEWKEK